VISSGSKVSVTLSDGTQYEAKILGQDETSDLAVLKIEAKNLKAVSIGSSKDLQVGQSVVAIGNPLSEEFSQTVTNGIISGVNRKLKADNQSFSLIQTNAAINSGNSGGALVDSNGKLIGIMGANGAGKSTLLKTIAGILPLKQGEIWFDAQPLSKMNAIEKSQHIAYLAQNTQILDQSARNFALNRGENLALNIANTARKNFLQEKLMQEKSSQDSKSHNLANKNLTDENHTPNLEQNSKQNPAQNQANENEISKNKAQNLANISQAQNTQICSCKQKNLNSQIGEILNQYENLAIGFWLDRGGATPKFAKFLREICGKKIALFMSCGADPQSEHSQKIIDKVASNLIAQGNEIAGKFVCQGKISDEIIAQIRAIYAQKNIEIPASRIENWEKSRPHPDENDLKNAREFFAKVFC